MSLPVVVQTPTLVLAASASSVNLTMPGAVTPGNSLIGGVRLIASATRSWTVTDTVDAGNWTSDVLFQPSASQQIHHRHNASAGTPTITWTVSAGTFSGSAVAIEVSGLDTGASPQTGTFTDAGATTSHKCNSAAITGTDVLAFCVCGLSGVSGFTVGSGYSSVPGSDASHMYQYGAKSSMNDDGPYTTSGTPRQLSSCMAVFSSPASSTRPFTFPRRVGGGFPRRVHRR